MTEVVEFFKRNHDKWFSVKEVSDNIDKNLRTVRSNVKDLLKRNMVIRKEVDIGGKVGIVTKYRYATTNDSFDAYKKIYHQVQLLQHQQVCGDYMTQHLLNAVIIQRLDELIRLVRNGQKKV